MEEYRLGETLKRASVGRNGTLYGLKSLVLWTLLIKAALLGWAYLAYFLFPFNTPNYWANFVYPAGEAPHFWTPLKTWDGQIYLYLSDHGYHPHQFTNAFYPLFPFLVRVAGLLLGGRPLLGGLLLSQACAVLAMVYLYRLCLEYFDKRTAFFTCLFLLAFPTGFYLGMLYTESLFLLLAIAYFFYWDQKRYGLSAFCAFWLPLTRPTGILVLFPALMAWREEGKNQGRPTGRRWLPTAAIILGAGAYFLAMKAMTGDAFCAFEAEKSFIFHFDVQNLTHPLQWFARTFLSVDSTPPGLFLKLLNRFFFLLYLGVLVLWARALNRVFFVYCLALGLVPALSGNLGSYMRYLLVLFPLFMALALRFRGKEVPYLLTSFGLQAYFAMQQALDYFVT